MTAYESDLLDALRRVVEKAVPQGEDEDGFIQGYAQGTGAIHNAIRVLAANGVHVRPCGTRELDLTVPERIAELEREMASNGMVTIPKFRVRELLGITGAPA